MLNEFLTEGIFRVSRLPVITRLVNEGLAEAIITHKKPPIDGFLVVPYKTELPPGCVVVQAVSEEFDFLGTSCIGMRCRLPRETLLDILQEGPPSVSYTRVSRHIFPVASMPGIKELIGRGSFDILVFPEGIVMEFEPLFGRLIREGEIGVEVLTEFGAKIINPHLRGLSPGELYKFHY